MLVDSVLLSEHSLLRIFRDVLGRLDDMGGVFTVVWRRQSGENEAMLQDNSRTTPGSRPRERRMWGCVTWNTSLQVLHEVI